ncbi:MAG: hypothetical protein FD138_205 [Planctomycetota bacterium]|nr:MAG: hypothetical protein FD138_205 [Planctomycetota bacterium]
MENDRRDNRQLKSVTVALGVLIVALLVVAAIAIPRWYTAPKTAAEFGDMFGAPNALFSGLAFLGVIVAILLQREELELQREEIRQNRFELAGQREQLTLQNETFRRQAFEATFFQMLSLHHTIVSGMNTVREGKYSGRDCFWVFYSRLKDKLTTERFRERKPRTFQVMEEAYIDLYDSIQVDVGHYFRNLYHIVKFVDQSDVANKRFYTNLIRAQLSSHELLMLFYNCVSPLGRDKFKPLVERYGLLKNMPTLGLFEANHVEWYQNGAFSGSAGTP